MTDATKHILIIGAALADEFANYAGSAARTSIIARGRSMEKLVESHHARAPISPRDSDDSWIRAAIAIHNSRPVTGIVAFGESNQIQAARIAAQLRLPFHTVETAATVHDKHRMREQLNRHGLDDIPHARIHSAHEIADWTRRHGYPCIVKPSAASGSAGVSVVRGPVEEQAAYDRAHSQRGSRANSDWPGITVEAFLDGTHVSVEAISESGRHHVIAVTATAYDPHTFVQLGHATPAALELAQLHRIESYVPEVLDALGIASGPTHTELMLTSRGPRVIETHLRLGGDFIPELVRRATGYDMQTATFELALGQEVRNSLPRIHRPPTTAHAVWFRSAEADCIVERIHQSEPTNIKQLVPDGAAVRAASGIDSRILCAFAEGPTASDALQRARRKLRRADIDTAPMRA
ncbi:acetyl-CoA carboxylase biotin carboxylase subunit family protein [Nocardia sp. NPDC051321]|uniref:acetyl-CoA carboxylase biotin carboxylase subunit family protein n=1 Tax=Nocardia sp. NPDC051321 TaxID=3364323 RepID=UPI0037996523